MRVLRMRMTLLLAGVSLLAGTLLLAQAPGKSGRNPKAPDSAADKTAIQRGKAIYKECCGICHYAASPAKKIGPGLKGLSQRSKFANGKPVNEASLRAWIESGGKDMPSFKGTLKPDQINDLIVYLKTL